MGNTTSKVEIIGKTAEGYSIYSTDVRVIKSLLNTGGVSRVASVADIPAGFEFAFSINGASDLEDGIYIRKAQFITDLFTRCFENATIFSKFDKSTLRSVLKYSLPILIYRHDDETIKEILSQSQLSKSFGSSTVKEILQAAISILEKNGYHDMKCNPKLATPANDAYYKLAASSVHGGAEEPGALALDGLNSALSVRNSEAKKKLVSVILDVLIKLTGRDDYSGISNETEKLNKVIDKINSLGNVSDAQAKDGILKIAKAINSAYGSTIIAITPDARLTASMIAELLSAINTSLHAEFFSVQGGCKNTIRSLYLLKSILEENNANMLQKVGMEKSPELMTKMLPYKELNQMTLDEITRRLAILENLIHTAIPEDEKSVASLFSSNDRFRKFAETLKKDSGEESFLNILRGIVGGLGMTARLAKFLNEALQKIGMTLEEYKSSNSLRILDEKVTAAVMNAGGDTTKVQEYMRALEALKTYSAQASQVDSYMKLGGDIYDSLKSKQESIKVRQESRNLIIVTFVRRLNDLLNVFIASLMLFAHKIGSEIPMSAQLEQFRRLLQMFNRVDITNASLHYALLGLTKDVLSIQTKDSFLSELDMLKNHLDMLITLPLYSGSLEYFKGIQSSINSITELVRSYTSNVAARFGAGEGDDCQGFYDNDSIKHQISGAAELPKILPSEKSIVDALRVFDYYYRAAEIKQNMKVYSSELDQYGDKYETLVSESIANYLGDEIKKYEALRTALQDKSHDRDVLANPIYGIATQDDLDKQREAALAFLTNQMEVKKKFWSVVEAVDAYMRIFTNKIATTDIDVAAFYKMLSNVKLTELWYDETTGNTLTTVFDSFPSGINNYGLGAGEVFMPPAQLNAPAQDIAGQHYYQRLGVAVNANNLPGIPYLVTMPLEGDGIRKKLSNLSNSFGLIKFLLSIFVRVGQSFDGEDLDKKVFLTPANIRKYLDEYMQASALAQGFDIGAASQTIATDAKFSSLDDLGVILDPLGYGLTPSATGPQGNIAPNSGTYSKIDGAKFVVGLAASEMRYAGANTQSLLFKKRWGVWMRSINHSLADKEGFTFKQEDKYFVLIMKALAAKVLTVLGKADLTDRPSEYNGISSMRMILGGYTGALPQIEDGAVELYLRLPLLLQFYRDLFSYDQQNDYVASAFNNTAEKISMIPDFTGTFAGLIRFIFRHPKGMDFTLYSDDDIKELITEVNNVYKSMLAKYPSNTVKSIINELVMEINRRYGIVTKEDRDLYNKEINMSYGYNTTIGLSDITVNSVLDVPILPGETDDGTPQLSGAQRLLNAKMPLSSGTTTQSFRRIVDDAHYKLLVKFREKLDSYFEKADETIAFKPAIDMTQNKLKREQNEEKRFAIISELLRGADLSSKIDGIKYLAFHETVISGLNVLSGMHTILARFKQHVLAIDIDLLKKHLFEYMHSAGGLSSVGFVRHLMDTLKRAKVTEDNSELEQLLELVNGRFEAQYSHGGHVHTGQEYLVKATSGVVPNVGIAPVLISRFGNAVGGNRVAGANNPSVISLLTDKDLSVYEAAARTQGNGADKQKIDCFFRFMFSREAMMSELLNLLYGVSNDFQSLVDLRLDSARISLNFSKLKVQINDMFQYLKIYIELFRPLIHPTIFNDYVNRENIGSYYWLFEQLNNKIVLGRPVEALPAGASELEYTSLDEMEVRLNKTFAYLTQEYATNGSGLHNNPATAPSVAANRDSFDKVFAREIFYDASLPQSGLAPSSLAPRWDALNGATSQPVLVDYLRNPFDQLHVTMSQGARVVDTRYLARFGQLYSWNDEVTPNRSIMFSFNQLIAKFIQNMFDASSQKIYSGLINHFASGTFSKNITDQFSTYPDTVPLLFNGSTKGEAVAIPPIANLATIADQPLVKNAITRALITLVKLRVNIMQSELINGRDSMGYLIVLADLAETVAQALRNNNASPASIALYQAFDNTVITIADAQMKLKDANDPFTGEAILRKTSLHTQPNAAIEGIVLAILANTRSEAADSLIALQPQGTAFGVTYSRFLKLYPFVSTPPTLGRNDMEYKCELAAAMIVALAYGQGTFNDVNNEVLRFVNRAATTYAPAESTHLSHLVKYDDLLNVNSDYLFDANVPVVGSLSYLFAARDEPVHGLVKPGSIRNLGNAQAYVQSALQDSLQFGRRGDPTENNTLFTSLSVILKSLVSAKTNNNVLLYTIDNVADIPLYMKERYRANLPQFRNYFKELQGHAELLRHLINFNQVDLTRDYSCVRDPAALRVTIDHNPWPWVLQTPTIDSSATKARFAGILDSIIRGAQSFIQACDTVLREIGGDVKYLEIYQGSLKDYKAQNNADPLMPLSTVLNVLRNTSADNYLQFFPLHSLGDDSFKFAYGTRILLNTPSIVPLLEHNPGFNNIIETYNLSADETKIIDKHKSEGFHKTFITLLRYIYEAKHIKGLMSLPGARESAGLFTKYDMIVNSLAPTGAPRVAAVLSSDQFSNNLYVPTQDAVVSLFDGSLSAAYKAANQNIKTAKVSFSLNNPLSKLIRITESTMREDRIREYVEYLKSTKADNVNAAIHNIIELNIIPINVHAMMKDIELSHLYNYAYSFDRFVVELYYGSQNMNSKKIISQLSSGNNIDIMSAKDMMVALLINPYLDCTQQYEKYVHEVMLGVPAGSDIGRPKFVTDQLLNKALFGELYQSRNDYNENGPSSARGFTFNRDSVKKLMENIMFEAFMFASRGGLFAGAALQNNHRVQAFIAAASDILFGNPAEMAEDLYQKLRVSINMINGGGNAAQYNKMAQYISILGALLVDTMFKFENDINNKNLKSKQALLSRYAAEISFIVTLAGLIPDHQGNAALGHLGYASTAAAQAGISNIVGAMFQGGLPAAGAFGDLVSGHGVVHRTTIDDILARLMNKCEGAPSFGQYVAVQGYQGLANIDIALKIRSFGLSSPLTDMAVQSETKLHWLTTHNLDAARYQPDNDNVVDDRQVQFVDLPTKVAQELYGNGKMRFDTVLVRNMFFLTMLMRTLRIKLHREVMYNKDVFMTSAPATRNSVTELYGNNLQGRPYDYTQSTTYRRYL